MSEKISSWSRKRYPQSYVIRKPYVGTLIVLVFAFLFVLVYRPAITHESPLFSYWGTMAIYCISPFFPVIWFIQILKKFRYFSKSHEWTLLKELILDFLILLLISTIIYFVGFIIEAHTDRWNMSTYLNSCKNTFIIGLLPFTISILFNHKYIFAREIEEDINPVATNSIQEQVEELVQIKSQLKKEKLSFYPSQFIYAESEGNYVNFYLDMDGRIQKKVIRNSISNIEQQMFTIPYYIRTHRAFIVNVKKVRSQKGNTLGYRLKLTGTEAEIPVSRQKAQDFSNHIRQYL